MPQLFKIGPYSIYFWSNESNPLEPVHVHISEGRATANATKSGSQAEERHCAAIIIQQYRNTFSPEWNVIWKQTVNI
jgi:hypothetical protein